MCKCIICGSDTYALQAKWDNYFAYANGLKSIYTMVRYCESCKFSFVQDRDNSFDKYYALTYGSEQGKKTRINFNPPISDYWLDAWDAEFISEYNQERSKRVSSTVESLGLSPKKILDFGGGNGEYASLVFKNSKVHTFDPASKDPLIESEYDIIFMSQVLEHLVDPLEVIKTLKTKLSADGIIWIEVPEENKYFNDNIEEHSKYQNGFDVSEHINFYSETSFQTIAKKLGFKSCIWFSQYYLLADGVSKNLVDYFYNVTCQTAILSDKKLDTSIVNLINNDSDFGTNKTRSLRQVQTNNTIPAEINTDHKVDRKYGQLSDVIDRIAPKNSIQRDIVKSAYYLIKANYKLVKKIYKIIKSK